MAKIVKLAECINWEWVHSHHPKSDGRVRPGAWCRTIILHAKENGFRGAISERGACAVINRNLY